MTDLIVRGNYTEFSNKGENSIDKRTSLFHIFGKNQNHRIHVQYGRVQGWKISRFCTKCTIATLKNISRFCLKCTVATLKTFCLSFTPTQFQDDKNEIISSFLIRKSLKKSPKFKWLCLNHCTIHYIEKSAISWLKLQVKGSFELIVCIGMLKNFKRTHIYKKILYICSLLSYWNNNNTETTNYYSFFVFF